MRPYLRIGCLVFALVLVSGCPWINPEKHQFTSADTSWRGGGLFDNLAPGDTATDVGAEGEAEQREVVEPDVIRRDGALMYVLNQYRGLTIVDLDQQVLLAQVPT